MPAGTAGQWDAITLTNDPKLGVWRRLTRAGRGRRGRGGRHGGTSRSPRRERTLGRLSPARISDAGRNDARKEPDFQRQGLSRGSFASCWLATGLGAAEESGKSGWWIVMPRLRADTVLNLSEERRNSRCQAPCPPNKIDSPGLSGVLVLFPLIYLLLPGLCLR